MNLEIVPSQLMWTDVHCHLDKLEVSPEDAVKAALDQGVTKMFTIGTEPRDLPIVLELADKFAPYVYCTLGIHPHDVTLFDDSAEAFIRANGNHPRVVALGEMGLDYFYDNAPRSRQQEVFRRQMRMAQDLQLPIEIHTRDAEEDTATILEEFRGKVRGLLHCFTGTWDLAKVALDLGYNISISGIVTFKNAESLREVVRKVPIDRLHVETDAPFLSPVPLRGRKNQPSHLPHTAQCVADLKGVSLETLAHQTQQNASQLFPKGFINSMEAK